MQIIHGMIYTMEGDVYQDGYIITEGTIIKAVGPMTELASIEEDAIDLQGKSVYPGFIDAHAHYEFIGPETFNTFSISDSDEMKTLNMVYNARQALLKGFTTVRVTGTAFRGFGCIDAKRAIDKGYFTGARFIVAPHALGVPGGHWDFSIFYCNTNPMFSEYMEQPFAITSGADMFKHLVRKQI